MTTLQDDLIAKGYRKFPPTAIDQYVDYTLQKRFDDEVGKRYFVNVRHYPASGAVDESFQYQVSCDTDGGGYAWLKFKEDTLEAAEDRALKLWEACGAVYYEKWDGS